MHTFGFDELKSRAGLHKHGIDFIKAQALWKDLNIVEIPARTIDEPRFMVIGKIDDKCWSAPLHIEIIIYALSQCGGLELKR